MEINKIDISISKPVNRENEDKKVEPPMFLERGYAPMNDRKLKK